MANELSIENIKKEIMDKLLNSVQIINYFKKYIEEGTPISKLYNNVIFDYDSSHAVGDYITVEVSKYDSHKVTNNDETYRVTIKMGLKEEKDICAMSILITDIVNKIYPNRRRFSNVPVVTVDNCVNINNYSLNTVLFGNERSSQLNRMIVFYIEN